MSFPTRTWEQKSSKRITLTELQPVSISPHTFVCGFSIKTSETLELSVSCEGPAELCEGEMTLGLWSHTSLVGSSVSMSPFDQVISGGSQQQASQRWMNACFQRHCRAERVYANERKSDWRAFAVLKRPGNLRRKPNAPHRIGCSSSSLWTAAKIIYYKGKNTTQLM